MIMLLEAFYTYLAKIQHYNVVFQDPGESDKCATLAIQEFREGQHLFELRVITHVNRTCGV